MLLDSSSEEGEPLLEPRDPQQQDHYDGRTVVPTANSSSFRGTPLLDKSRIASAAGLLFVLTVVAKIFGFARETVFAASMEPVRS